VKWEKIRQGYNKDFEKNIAYTSPKPVRITAENFGCMIIC
jgi:hypothetical protein